MRLIDTHREAYMRLIDTHREAWCTYPRYMESMVHLPAVHGRHEAHSGP